MMTEEIILKLKSFKSIKPDKKYAEISRVMLLSIMQMPKPRRTWFLLKPLLPSKPHFTIASVLRYSMPVSIVAVFMFLMLGGYSAMRSAYFAFNFPGLMNENALAAEFDDFEIQIKIAEVSYYNDSSRSVSGALDEAISETNHLSGSVIKKEGIIDEESPTNDKIDEILNDVL